MRRGKWLDTARAWSDTNVSYCDVCGRLIPRRVLGCSTTAAKKLNTCSPDCEDLYDSYLKTLSCGKAEDE